MIGVANEEIREVLSRVTNWPACDRIVLARKILETVEAAPATARRGYTAEEVMALLKTPQPAPDDETVKQWVDEHRAEKYGQ